MDNNRFLKKKPELADENREPLFTDEELIQIYNVLGYSRACLITLNGILQDANVLNVLEDNNRFINTIRCKIVSELTRRGMEN